MPDNHLVTSYQEGQNIIASAVSDNTRKAYQKQWLFFTSWCNGNSFQALPCSTDTLSFYVAHLAKSYKLSTIEQAVAAIVTAQTTKGYDNPGTNKTIELLMKGLRRQKGQSKTKKTPLLVKDIKAMVDSLGTSEMDIRNRALLLLGFVGAFRRSELVSLKVSDLDFQDRGLAIIVRRSKTDQEGKGQLKAIPYSEDLRYCPVRASKEWLQISMKTSEDLLFDLTDRQVANIVKRLAHKIGRNEHHFSGHSLRSGFVTQAVMNGRQITTIMAQTGHKSIPILNGYIRRASIFDGNAANGLM
jgi:integrase